MPWLGISFGENGFGLKIKMAYNTLTVPVARLQYHKKYHKKYVIPEPESGAHKSWTDQEQLVFRQSERTSRRAPMRFVYATLNTPEKHAPYVTIV